MKRPMPLVKLSFDSREPIILATWAAMGKMAVLVSATRGRRVTALSATAFDSSSMPFSATGAPIITPMKMVSKSVAMSLSSPSSSQKSG